MQAGKLRHRVSLQQPVQAQAADGGVTNSWLTVISVPASIEPLNGRELWNAQQVQPDVTHRVTLRYHPNVSPRWRFLFGYRTFNVLTVLNTDERNRELICMCMEAV